METLNEKKTKGMLKYESKKNFIESDDFDEFIVDCKEWLSQGSYGSRIEHRLIKDLGLIQVDKSKDKGDCVDIYNNYFEIKTSYTSTNKNWNLLHIKPYQDYKYMLILIIDIMDNFKQHFYLIRKEDMNKDNFKSYGYSNGTKETNEYNTKVEYRVTISKKNILTLNKLNIMDGDSLADLNDYFKYQKK